MGLRDHAQGLFHTRSYLPSFEWTSIFVILSIFCEGSSRSGLQLEDASLSMTRTNQKRINRKNQPIIITKEVSTLL